MEGEIKKTLQYFAYFAYPPTFEELYRYLSIKTTKSDLKKVLEKMMKSRKVRKSEARYTLGEYSILLEKYPKRYAISQRKEKKAIWYVRILSIIPFIHLVGISGSLAMDNAQEKDDIDVFIITASHRMWITRLISLIVAQLLGLRRKRGVHIAPDKICMNLFFDERDLTLPKSKQTIYGAHEVLQMEPVLNDKHAYERFLAANSWAFKIFPNAEKIYTKQYKYISKISKNTKFEGLFLANFIERIAKKLQLSLIKRHRKKELITPTQLWFFPDDFEVKLKRKLKLK